MNKYDKKILEIAPNNGSIHELIRRPIRSGFLRFVDMMFDNVLVAADGLSSTGAYYLLVGDTSAELVHIEKDLQVSQQNVTQVVQQSVKKRSFEFDGNKYKVHRKIR